MWYFDFFIFGGLLHGMINQYKTIRALNYSVVENNNATLPANVPSRANEPTFAPEPIQT